MKIPTRVAVEIANGLAGLDGRNISAKDNNVERVISAPYKFSGTLRKIIFRNLARLRVEIEVHNNASQALFRSISGGREMMDEKDPAQAALLATYHAQLRDLLNEEVEVELQPIFLSALDLDKNDIPGSILAMLDPIIKEDNDDGDVRSTG